MSGNAENPRRNPRGHESWDVPMFHVFYRENINVYDDEVPYRGEVITVNGLTIDHLLWTMYVQLRNECKYRDMRMPKLRKTPRILLREITQEWQFYKGEDD